MKPIVTINWQAAPKNWEKFQKWHALACPSDPLTAQERWETKYPKEVKSDIPATKGKK